MDQDHCECTLATCSCIKLRTASDNKDEMDDYIEAQLDGKNGKKVEEPSGGDGLQPSLAMKETKLD